MSYLLLIDSRVKDIPRILECLTETTVAVIFDYEMDTYNSIRERAMIALSNAGHGCVNSIGIMQHNYDRFTTSYEYIDSMTGHRLVIIDDTVFMDETDTNNPIQIDTSHVIMCPIIRRFYRMISHSQPGFLDSIDTWRPFVDFIWSFSHSATVDFMPCNIWTDDDWYTCISQIRQVTGLIVSASSNNTGIDGDFILESDNKSLIDIYFTRDILSYPHALDTVTIPGPPALLDLTPGNKNIVVSFLPPTNTGGSDITNYLYSLNGGPYIPAATTVSPFTIYLLQNGINYSVSLVAVNSIGQSATPSNILSAMPYGIPDPPTNLSLTQIGLNASVQFVNGNANGRTITDIQYSVNGQAFVSSGATTSPIIITSVSPGLAYSIRLIAVNSVGQSVPSAAASITMSYNFNYDNAMSIDTDGNQFIMTIRNEISGPAHCRTSLDGIRWNICPLPNTYLSPSNPYIVKWTGSRFVVGGDITRISDGSCVLLKSDTGTQFTPVPINLSGQIYDIDIGGEYPHTVSFPLDTTLGLGGKTNDTYSIVYSHDRGKTWTPAQGSYSIFTVARCACWIGTQWIAGGSGPNVFATSTDNGHTWVGRGGSHIFSTQVNEIAWSPELHMAVAVGKSATQTNSIAYSYDGIYWTGCGATSFLVGVSVAWNGSMWVAVGTTLDNGTMTGAYSYDGINWTTISGLSLASSNVTGVRWTNNQWNIYGDRYIGMSYDALTWSYADNIVWNPTKPAPVYNGLYYLSPGYGQYIGLSIDNIYWYTNAATFINGITSYISFAWNQCNQGVAEIQPITIAAGEGTHTLAYSINGIQWIGLGNSIFSIRGNAVAWNGEVWCAGGAGQHCLAYSYDGLQWIPCSIVGSLFTQVYDIAWNGTVFVAVGEGPAKMAISNNGKEWSFVSVPFTSYASSVSWTGRYWIAYGSGGTTTTISSSDKYARIWTPTPTPNMSVLYATDVSPTSISGTGTSPQNVSDGSANTQWTTSAINDYVTFDFGTAIRIARYIVTNTNVTSWRIAGSTNGSTFTTIDNYTVVNNIIPDITERNISTLNTSSYRYYRFTALSYSGGLTSGYVGEIRMYTASASDATLPVRMKPIVTRHGVVNTTQIYSANPSVIFTISDTSLSYSNNLIAISSATIPGTGDGSYITSYCFDGTNFATFAQNGTCAYVSNSNANVSYVFTAGPSTGLSAAYSACFNKKYMVVGGLGGIVYGSISTGFYGTNAGQLMNTVYCVGSNSGYGFTYSPNTLHVNSGERISIVSPKFGAIDNANVSIDLLKHPI